MTSVCESNCFCIHVGSSFSQLWGPYTAVTPASWFHLSPPALSILQRTRLDAAEFTQNHKYTLSCRVCRLTVDTRVPLSVIRSVTHHQPSEQRHKHGISATEPALQQKGRTISQPRAEPQLHRTNNTEVHTRVTDTTQRLIHRQAGRTYRLTALSGLCSDSRSSWPRSEQITWCGTLHPSRDPEGRGQQPHRCSLRRTALTPDQAAAAASFTALHDGENAPLLRRNEQLTNYCSCLDTRLNMLLMRCININIKLSTCCRWIMMQSVFCLYIWLEKR